MNGQIIPGTCIAVDFWKIRGVQEQLIHFLTHLHGDHIVGLTSSWNRPIYCSEFTAHLLHAHHNVPKSLMNILYVNQCTLVNIPNTHDSFCVTAYDANHCPGALMLYFEGKFGNFFYTGDFRFSSDVMESLQHLVGKIDRLYLDNTFCSPECVFPSREECQQKIINIVKDHPDYDIIIGMRKLGKESMLGLLAVEINETIYVSPERYQISQCIFDSNVFAVTTKDEKARIRTMPIHSVTRELIYQKNQITPTIGILPTAIFTGLKCKPFSRDPNIFMVPYSDHSSFPELVEFVRRLHPTLIFPIVIQKRGPFGKDISNRFDMSVLKSHVRKTETLPSNPASFENHYQRKCLSKENVDTSFNDDTSARKFLYLRPDLLFQDILVPQHSLKRKSSFPDKRKKKIATGVIFDTNFGESTPDSEEVLNRKSEAVSNIVLDRKLKRDKSDEDKDLPGVSKTILDSNDNSCLKKCSPHKIEVPDDSEVLLVSSRIDSSQSNQNNGGTEQQSDQQHNIIVSQKPLLNNNSPGKSLLDSVSNQKVVEEHSCNHVSECDHSSQSDSNSLSLDDRIVVQNLVALAEDAHILIDESDRDCCSGNHNIKNEDAGDILKRIDTINGKNSEPDDNSLSTVNDMVPETRVSSPGDVHVQNSMSKKDDDLLPSIGHNINNDEMSGEVISQKEELSNSKWKLDSGGSSRDPEQSSVEEFDIEVIHTPNDGTGIRKDQENESGHKKEQHCNNKTVKSSASNLFTCSMFKTNSINCKKGRGLQQLRKPQYHNILNDEQEYHNALAQLM